MEKLILIIAVVATALFSSCRGHQTCPTYQTVGINLLK